jgi:hypothetical protein
MPRNQQFEIPQELRQLAEENVERARKLYLQFMEGVSQAMGAWSTPTSNEASPGFKKSASGRLKSRERMPMLPSTWQEMWQTLRTSRNW